MTKKYKVGQIINIGYYGGFHNKDLIKTKAEIIKISGNMIYIKVHLSNIGYRTMFGYESELVKLEKNYMM